MAVVSDGRLGIIATASYGNKWRTRANLQQASIDLSVPAGTSFEQVMTDNQVTVTGLLGVGLELGNQQLRRPGLYIRATLKRSSQSPGQNYGGLLGGAYRHHSPAWSDRQPVAQQIQSTVK